MVTESATDKPGDGGSELLKASQTLLSALLWIDQNDPSILSELFTEEGHRQIQKAASTVRNRQIEVDTNQEKPVPA